MPFAIPKTSLLVKVLVGFLILFLIAGLGFYFWQENKPEKKLAKQVGIPKNYRLATEDEIAYFVPAKKGEKPYIERLTLKIGANGETLVPVYDPNSIIGQYTSIDLEKIYPEEYWLGKEQQRYKWIAGLEEAVFTLLQGDRKEARRNLLWVQKQIKESNIFSSQKKLDKNGDGVADHMEELSKSVNALLEKL